MTFDTCLVVAAVGAVLLVVVLAATVLDRITTGGHR